MEESYRNPWISIWTQPRETIQNIVNTDPYRHVVLLSAIAGIGNALNSISSTSRGDDLSLVAIFIIALVVGSLGGIISLYIFGALLRLTGGWMGGRAKPHEIRAAIAWGSIIWIWLMALWIPELLLFGKELFTTETPRMDSSTLLTMLFSPLLLIEFVFEIWGFVVYLKCIGEVQGFSALKAFGNLLLAGLVIIVPCLGVVALVMLLK